MKKFIVIITVALLSLYLSSCIDLGINNVKNSESTSDESTSLPDFITDVVEELVNVEEIAEDDLESRLEAETKNSRTLMTISREYLKQSNESFRNMAKGDYTSKDVVTKLVEYSIRSKYERMTDKELNFINENYSIWYYPAKESQKELWDLAYSQIDFDSYVTYELDEEGNEVEIREEVDVEAVISKMPNIYLTNTFKLLSIYSFTEHSGNGESGDYIVRVKDNEAEEEIVYDIRIWQKKIVGITEINRKSTKDEINLDTFTGNKNQTTDTNVDIEKELNLLNLYSTKHKEWQEKNFSYLSSMLSEEYIKNLGYENVYVNDISFWLSKILKGDITKYERENVLPNLISSTVISELEAEYMVGYYYMSDDDWHYRVGRDSTSNNYYLYTEFIMQNGGLQIPTIVVFELNNEGFILRYDRIS